MQAREQMKTMNKFIKTLLVPAISLCTAILIPSAATAQSLALEEIIVTATKRAESAQDLSMSVQSISGQKLESLGIDNFENMAVNIPNFTVSDSLIVNQITMRGVGSGEDRGFEQSVSTFKDGVYLPRSRQTRSPFFDVDRVEVLRGPQAVLFGLNSTAGAISVHGAINKPGDETELSLTGEYEAEYGGVRVRAIAGGSAGETLGWRLALETKDSGDGWLENPVSGDSGATEHDMARVSLVWEPSENMSATFRWEHNTAETNGQMTDVANGNLNLPGDGALGGLIQRVAGINAFIPGSVNLRGDNGEFDYVSFVENNPRYQSLDDPIASGGRSYRNSLGADQEIDNVSLSLDWALGENTLTALVGYSDYFYDAAVNIVGLPYSLYSGTNYEEYEQTSLEVRLASATGNKFEWIVGAYYHDSELFTDQPNVFDISEVLALAVGLPPAIVTAAVTGAPLIELAGADLAQDSDLTSIFLSGTYHFSDTFRVTGGLRYSDEEKSYVRNGSTPGSGLYLKNPDGSPGFFLGGSILNPVGLAVGRTTGTVDSDNTMPELMAEWDISDDVMLYARYAESAKAGGVATAGSVALDGLIYGDEQAESIEIGMKGRFLDGRAELNAALFSTDFTDLQVKSSAIGASGAVVTIIGNAGEASSTGLELDGRILISEGVTLGGTLAFLNAEYDSYAAGPCNRSQSTPAGSLPGTCNLAGEKLPFAADTSASIYADIMKPISDNLNLIANLTVSYSDDYTVEGTLEPTLAQESWTKLSGRVGVEAADASWSLALIGQNLTDEEVWLGGQPLFGYDMVYPAAPRTITLQGTYKF